MKSLLSFQISYPKSRSVFPEVSANSLPLPCHRREILRGRAGLLRILPQWDQLMERSAVRTPFLRADWLELWAAIFDDEHEICIGAAWLEDGTLAAAAPLALSPGREGAKHHLRHLTFLGGMGEVVSEGQDLLAVPGMEPVLDILLDELLTAVSEEWDLAFFPYMDLESPHLPRLRAALERAGGQPALVNEQASPCIPLDAPDWEGCLKQASPRFRRKLRKRGKSAESAFRVTFRAMESSCEVMRSMDLLMRLHGQRWKQGESLFLHPRSRRFHAELAQRWCPSRQAWLHLLEFDGQPAAMDYLFVENGKVWDYQGGWNALMADYTPSHLLRVHGIKRAISAGLREYDLLAGGEYKTHWTRQGRRVADLEAVNPRSLKAQAFLAMRSVKRRLAGPSAGQGAFS